MNIQKVQTGKLFDAIVMDPPWPLSSKNPTRGVTISYKTLSNSEIEKLPIETLQTDGFIFLWTINKEFTFCLNLLKKWNYEYINEIAWIKSTSNQKLYKGNGYYLQHCKETCFVGVKVSANIG